MTIRAFDILFLNGRELTGLLLSERSKYLLEVVPTEYIVEGRNCENEVELMKFYEEASSRVWNALWSRTSTQTTKLVEEPTLG